MGEVSHGRNESDMVNHIQTSQKDDCYASLHIHTSQKDDCNVSLHIHTKIWVQKCDIQRQTDTDI